MGKLNLVTNPRSILWSVFQMQTSILGSTSPSKLGSTLNYLEFTACHSLPEFDVGQIDDGLERKDSLGIYAELLQLRFATLQLAIDFGLEPSRDDGVVNIFTTRQEN